MCTGQHEMRRRTMPVLAIKPFSKKYVPENMRSRLRRFEQLAKLPFRLGSRYHCPCCDMRFDRLLPFYGQDNIYAALIAILCRARDSRRIFFNQTKNLSAICRAARFFISVPNFRSTLTSGEIRPATMSRRIRLRASFREFASGPTSLPIYASSNCARTPSIS